jgi:hypothetical protein
MHVFAGKQRDKETVVAQLPTSFFKYWVLTSIPDEEGGLYEAQPLGFPPNWPPRRGPQDFDFREDGKFSYITFAPNDGRVELDGSWELDVEPEYIHIEIPDTDHAEAISLAGSGWSGKSASFTLEIVALDDERLGVRVLEQQRREDIIVPGDLG